MTYSELIKDYNFILEVVSTKRITEALSALGKLVDKCSNIDFRNRLNKNIDTYNNILKYSFEYGEDPEKEKVYFRLVKSLLELADEVKEELIIQHNLLSYYEKLRKKKSWQV